MWYFACGSSDNIDYALGFAVNSMQVYSVCLSVLGTYMDYEHAQTTEYLYPWDTVVIMSHASART